MMIPKLKGPNETIEMDASLRFGLGAVNHLTKEFFMLHTPDVIKGLPIHCGEMSVLMLVVDTWTGQKADPQSLGSLESIFKSSTVSLLSDNQAVINAVNNGQATDEFICAGIRYIHFQMALIDGQFNLSYIKTKSNIWADGLSRGDDKIVDELLGKGYKRVFIPENHNFRVLKN